MALSLTHSTVVLVPDDGTSAVGSDEWNAQHNFTLSSDVIVGRLSTAGTAQELNGTQITALLDPMSSTLKGLAPASGGGTINFLRADGTWAVPGGLGTTTIGTSTITGGTSGNFLFDNAGVYGERTPTQTTAVLDLFTSSLKGVVPASGGGTTNFLRADGSWAAAGGGGGTPGGSTLQLQYNNVGAFGGMSGTSWDDTNRSLTMTGATVTANHPVLDMTQTWNNVAVAFTGLRLNVTNTASAGFGGNNFAPLLVDLQIGGVSQFLVDRLGQIGISAGGKLSLDIGNSNNAFITNGGLAGNTSINFGTNGSQYAMIFQYSPYGGFLLNTTRAYGWGSLGAGTVDTALSRDAAGIVAIANGTNANGIRVYNWLDASSYERGIFDWTTTANTLTIGTQALGTGTVRAVGIVSGNRVYNFGVAPATQTAATYTVVDGDQWITFNGGATITVTLPTAANYKGREITMKTIAAFTVVSASSNVVPIGSATAGTAILPATVGKFVTLVCDGTNWITVQGN
jgi:hypothetical protein